MENYFQKFRYWKKKNTLTPYLQTSLLRDCVLNPVSRDTCIYSHICTDLISFSLCYKMIKWEPIPLQKLCHHISKFLARHTKEYLSMLWSGLATAVQKQCSYSSAVLGTSVLGDASCIWWLRMYQSAASSMDRFCPCPPAQNLGY